MTGTWGWAVGQSGQVRWDGLFEDLEAQLDAASAAELAAEVTDRTRSEQSLVELADRLVAHAGQPLAVHLAGGTTYEGVLVKVTQQWFVLRGPVLVPLAAVTSVSGLGAAAATTRRDSVRRRSSLASALRAVARDRSPVRLVLVDGSVLSGTLDGVGADHVDLAEHPVDEARRRSAVRSVRTVAFTALAAVQPAPGTSKLV